MPPPLSPRNFLGTLRSALRTFFSEDLSLQRADDGVRIVLQPRGDRQRPLSRLEVAAQREKQELTLMLAQLAELLGELPETRLTMRHLVFVEQALAKKGLRALHKLPLDVLQKALEQFEGLVVNWSSVGLASLRSKMAVAIIDREHMDPEAEADAYRTAAVMDIDPDAALPQEPSRSDDDALAAAYAALGSMAPAGLVETQSELGSPSARAVQREAARPLSRPVPLDSIQLRELQD